MVFAGTGVWKSKRGTPLLGCRRVFINDEQYGYNARDELISANEVSYAYDDIGNRTTAEGKTYTANNLNQYTAIDDFAPQYDDDGNQTLIKTETGIWSVTYNAENRPIRWESGDTVITMAFDRMGRRVSMRTLTPGFDLLQRFVYKDFLCVRQLRGPDATPYQSYVWDPTEPIATRPLVCQTQGQSLFYFHDGNKNVTELIDGTRGTLAVRYDYHPFGRMIVDSLDLRSPISFSSEYYDRTLSLVYYNYRHYSFDIGNWISRDLLGEDYSSNLYGFIKEPLSDIDRLGLSCASFCPDLCSKGARMVNGNVESRILPYGISPTAAEDLSDLETLEGVFSLANGGTTTITVALNSGAIAGVAIGGTEIVSDLTIIPGGTDIARAITEMIARHYGSANGYSVWTRVEYWDCEEKSCCLVCERNEFARKKTKWARCFPRNSLSMGVLTSPNEAQKKIGECEETHKSAIRAGGAQ